MPNLSFEDLDRLTRELSSLSRSGIPLPDGLRQLSSTLKPGRLKSLSGELAVASDKGVPLSQALSGASVSVPRGFVALIQCAEVSGDLRSVLAFAVEHSRRIKRHRSGVLTTLVYPTFVVMILIGTLYFLSNSIIPRLIETELQLGAEFPPLTRLVFGVSRWFYGREGALLAILLAALVVSVLLVRPIRERALGLLGRLPGFRPLIGLSDAALFTHTVGRMLKHRVPLPYALEASSLAVWEGDTRNMLEQMSHAAAQGNRVGPLLRGRIPSMAVYLFRQGEERGDLADTCEGIADYCEERFERVSKRALAILEPAILLAVALCIGAILAGIYLPLFSIPKVVGGM